MGSFELLPELLAALFTQKELRRFLHFGPDGARVVDSLDFDDARTEVAYQAAELLRRMGLVNRAFFERLREQRSARSVEIDAVASALLGSARSTEEMATHVIVLEAAIAGQVSAIDDGQIKAALGECREVGRLPLDLHDLTAEPANDATWSEGQTRIQTGVQEFLRTTVLPSQVRHVSVFGLAPIPWLMALGYALSETVEARVHQRLRVPSTWSWQPHVPELGSWQTRAVATEPDARDVAVLLSVSARVQLPRVDEALSPMGRATYELSLEAPALDAVRSVEQLEAFGQAYRALLVRIEREQPKIECLHIFTAAPVAVAIECGRRILHNADPPVVAYHFHERRYLRALELRP